MYIWVGWEHSKLMNVRHSFQIFTMYSQAICALFLSPTPFHLKLWVGSVISLISPPHMVSTLFAAETWKFFDLQKHFCNSSVRYGNDILQMVSGALICSICMLFFLGISIWVFIEKFSKPNGHQTKLSLSLSVSFSAGQKGSVWKPSIGLCENPLEISYFNRREELLCQISLSELKVDLNLSISCLHLNILKLPWLVNWQATRQTLRILNTQTTCRSAQQA